MELRDGRNVELRAVTPADAGRLEAFFATLTPDERRLRFFSALRVTAPVAEGFARIEERGGFGLVAIEPATGDVVADGRCGPVDDGLVDMAVTVRTDYQGAGLGRLLRDALSTEARRRGIRVLVADLLCDNQRMHRVLQSLPHVVVDRPDDRVARVAYRTDGEVPEWDDCEPDDGPAGPSPERPPRIVVESAAWMGTMDERALRAAGAQVALCPGPDEARGRTCPVASGGTCPLVAGADAVIFGLPLDDAAGRRVLDGHRAGAETSKVFVRPWPSGVPVDPALKLLTGSMAVEAFLDALGDGEERTGSPTAGGR